MNDALLVIGGLSMLFSFPVAHWLSRNTEIKSEIYSGYRVLVTCIFFLVASLVLCEALLQKIAGTSFYSLLRHGSTLPLTLFFVGVLEGIVYEYIGCLSLDFWYYPPAKKDKRIFLVIPVAWGIFMLIMQDTFAILRTVGLGSLAAFIGTALIPFVVIEGFNLYTKSWIYQGLFRKPLILFLGWLLLTYTFVAGYNAHFLSPFGF